jgi:hypothetical protein
VELSGPITGGTRGGAFGRPLVDLSTHGYRLDELVMTGTATRYRHAGGAAPSPDGHWTAEPVGEPAAYRTRLIVYRPADPAAFNGTAIVCWNNVTAGYDLFGGDAAEILEGGYAFVGVTVQKVGIEGLPPTPMGLAAWDPERYGDLSHPGDDFSFDIFTQAAAAARQLDGLDVRHVVAMGGSQSAGRLGAYVNAIQPITGAFDGFLLTIYFGSGSALEVGDTVVDINKVPSQSAASVLRGNNRLRDDLGVPVFVVNSELEAIANLNVRQADSDTFRYWEVAGTSHVSVQSMAVRTPKFARDFGMELPVTEGINRISMLPVYDAALHHLRRWVDEGVAPPEQPKITFDDAGEVVRDEHGIAVGGIRLPAADVPVATNSAVPLGPGIYPILQGSSFPFDVSKVRDLYADEADYAGRVEESARAAEKAGVVLPRDVEPTIAEAVAAYREIVGGHERATVRLRRYHQ